MVSKHLMSRCTALDVVGLWSKITTVRFPLAQAAEAFATADSRRDALKILIEVTKEVG